MLLPLYRIVVTILYAILFPFLGLLALAGSTKWRNRLGRGFAAASRGNSTQFPKNTQLIWAHAASAGEAQALAHFVNEYHQKNPNLRFVVTVVTDSGYHTANTALVKLITSGAVEVYFLPLDCPQSINKALKKVRPELFAFTETEIWPAWTAALVARNIPYVLLNARLTERSLKKYLQARSLIERTMQNYKFVVCQSQEHSERFRALGVPPERLCISGNLKSDAPSSQISKEVKRKWRKLLGVSDTDFLLVFGSIRSGEFVGALEMFQRLTQRFPQLKIALAPRHLERCAEIAGEAQRLGIPFQVYKENSNNDVTAGIGVTIIEAFGVLRELYGAAEIAFVGGSMIPIGGHNILEPPQVGTPVFFGPHTANVPEAVVLIKKRNCGAQVDDWDDFETQLASVITGEKKLGQWQDVSSDSDSMSDSESMTGGAMSFTIDKVETLMEKIAQQRQGAK